MLSYRRATGMLPAKDLERAKSWWADKMGLKPVVEMGDMGAYYEVGGSYFLLYPSEFAGTNQANAIGLEVEDVEATVKELRGNGVEFRDYDTPEIKTENGIMTVEVAGERYKGAWCTDSEGNIIAIGNAWRD